MAIEVFISYAHEDKNFRKALNNQLMPLKRVGLVSVWHDRMIAAGTEWESQIDAALERCQIVLLLVSPNFFASDYCYGKEAKRALERHHAGEARVIPVILKPCEWQIDPLAKLQALPEDGKAVTSWKTHDHAWVQVAKAIREIATEGSKLGSISKSEQLLEERWTHCQAGVSEKAVECAEEAARIARHESDKKTLVRALRSAARDLGDLLILERPDEFDAKKITTRIASHLSELETLDIPEAELYLEKALFARLDKRASDALKYAEEAETKTDNPETAAQALLVQLQAFWQLKTPEAGLALQERISSVMEKIEKGNAGLVLHASWLRTLCKAAKSNDEDIRKFIALVQGLITDGQETTAHALIVVDEVVSEFGRANELERVRSLLKLALELALSMREPMRTATIAIQTAEVEAELGDELEARKHLGIADKWIDTLKSNGDKKTWCHRKATALATRGRIESRLARKIEESDYGRSLQHRRAAHEFLKQALVFIDTHEADLVGDFGPFRADLCLQLGKAALALGQRLEAADHFQQARTHQVMADERFQEIAVEASMREADALLFGGKPDEARTLLEEMVDAPWTTERVRNDVIRNIGWIDEHVLSVKEWIKSEAADRIRNSVGSNPEELRHVVAEQTRPLVEWFREFPPKKGAGHAYSELFDIWGRGGFSRIVAAAQGYPLDSISVDATCVADIRMWARVFCPLYDTVIINWKGPMEDGLALVPMPDNLGPPGEFGGQGYIRTSDMLKGKDGWHVACGWGNFLPKDVSEFLATEALPLFRSGRLVLLPAPLIGCTQSAIGWTDNLFVDTLLGGVVKTAGMGAGDMSPSSRKAKTSRLLDLSVVSLPYFDNVPLSILDQVLNEMVEGLLPLRRLVQETLGSRHLREERWDGLRFHFTDIRDAFRQLDERYRAMAASRPEGAEWRISDLTGAFSAAERPKDTPGLDPMTDLLRSIAGSKPDLGPWIPFWRLREAGGQLNWTKPLDNRSEPPDEEARRRGFSNISQGWLFPGDGGPGMASAFTF
ncbi:MAG: toll/interleukin-1 receptor domain-containing protein [Magnetococcales bacterium]|nr:toll/interleukin-1 receptor domain-containing protein [Magnetococcales bacterium]